MAGMHSEFNEYATCSKCGMKKFCNIDGKHFICYSCANGNFPKVSWKIK